MVHIAEKFRQAYVERAAREKRREQRAWEQRRRREAKAVGQAERLIQQWEGEV